MKTYRGLIDMDCGRGKKPCPQKYQKDVQAACLNCAMAEVRVVDHDRKPLAVLKRGKTPETKPPAQKKTKEE